MIILFPSRASNRMFDRLMPFKHQEWKTYCDLMKNELSSVDSPADANLESVLPGLHQYHRSTVATLNTIEATQKQHAISLNQISLDVHQLTDAVRQSVDRDESNRAKLASIIIAGVRALLPDSSTVPTEAKNADLDDLAGLTAGLSPARIGAAGSNPHQPHPHPASTGTSTIDTSTTNLQPPELSGSDAFFHEDQTQISQVYVQ
jgi:hypothetical protein